MRHPRFSLGTLLWSVPVVAVVTLTAPGYLQAPPSTMVDLTAGAPSRCEVHRRRMKPQIVELRSGTNDRPRDQDDREAARRKHFPHTDESVDQAPLAGKYQFARVWACPDCTTARSFWTDKRKIQQRVQAEEHARRLAEAVEQQRRARGDQEDLRPDAAEKYSE